MLPVIELLLTKLVYHGRRNLTDRVLRCTKFPEPAIADAVDHMLGMAQLFGLRREQASVIHFPLSLGKICTVKKYTAIRTDGDGVDGCSFIGPGATLPAPDQKLEIPPLLPSVVVGRKC